MLDLKEYCKGKRVLIVVAHHDDEAYCFGALLCLIKGSVSKMRITAMTDMRRDKFEDLCDWICAETKTYSSDKGTRDNVYYVEDIMKVSCNVIEQIKEFKPDLIITHGNKVDGNHFHIFHIIVNLAVKYAVEQTGSIPIIVRADYGATIEIPQSTKGKLLHQFYNESQKWVNQAHLPFHFDILEKKS